MKIDISVIIPAFNPDEKILSCVKSILKNTGIDYEILIIDDGSRDASLRFFKALTNFSQVKIFHQKNQGVSAAREYGIKLSHGKYLAFVDQDDSIEENYLKTFFQTAEKGNYDIVIGGYKRVSSKKTLFQVIPNNKPLGKYLIMAPWARIYKKDFLVKNNLHFLKNPIGEDVYLNCIAYQYAKIFAISYLGYNWFYNEKSVSNSKQKGQTDISSVKFLLNSIYSELKKRGKLNQEVEYYFVKYVTWYIFFSVLKSNGTLALKFKNFKQVLNNFDYFFIDIAKNPYTNLFRDKGESIFNLLAITILIFILDIAKKFNLLKK